MIPPYTQSTHPFWNDPHISRSMLKAHLDPHTDRASRQQKMIEQSVQWILGLHPNPKTLLDLGCGPGLYTEKFYGAGLHVTGIDLSERSIRYAMQANPNIFYRVGNYLELAEENAYDMVTLIYYDYGVLSPEDRAILVQKIHCALKPGGMFVLDVLHENYKHPFQEGTGIIEMGDFFTQEAHTVTKTSMYYPDTRNTLEQYDVRTETETKTYYVWN